MNGGLDPDPSALCKLCGKRYCVSASDAMGGGYIIDGFCTHCYEKYPLELIRELQAHNKQLHKRLRVTTKALTKIAKILTKVCNQFPEEE